MFMVVRAVDATPATMGLRHTCNRNSDIKVCIQPIQYLCRTQANTRLRCVTLQIIMMVRKVDVQLDALQVVGQWMPLAGVSSVECWRVLPVPDPQWLPPRVTQNHLGKSSNSLSRTEPSVIFTVGDTITTSSCASLSCHLSYDLLFFASCLTHSTLDQAFFSHVAMLTRRIRLWPQIAAPTKLVGL